MLTTLVPWPQVDTEGNIVDSCFKTFGCGSAIASSSVATEWVKGRSIDDVRLSLTATVQCMYSASCRAPTCDLVSTSAVAFRLC